VPNVPDGALRTTVTFGTSSPKVFENHSTT
jgi:hypothetical protein